MTAKTVDLSARLSLTVREAAQVLGLSERSIWRLIQGGTMKSVAVGLGAGRGGRKRIGRRLITVTELKRFLGEQSEQIMTEETSWNQ